MNRLSRRHVLALSMAVPVIAMGGCSSASPDLEGVAVDASSEPIPDTNLLDELSLLAAYAGVIEAFPELLGTLTTIAEQHKAHAAALGATPETLDAVQPKAPETTKVRQAVGQLLDLERTAAAIRVEGTAATDNPENIRLLTFIAASEASHVPELRDLRKALAS